MTTLRIDPTRLKAARLRVALTQEGLGERAGVKNTTISQLERGVRPARLRTVRRLADALGVDVDAIADVIVAPDPEPVGTG